MLFFSMIKIGRTLTPKYRHKSLFPFAIFLFPFIQLGIASMLPIFNIYFSFLLNPDMCVVESDDFICCLQKKRRTFFWRCHRLWLNKPLFMIRIFLYLVRRFCSFPLWLDNSPAILTLRWNCVYYTIWDIFSIDYSSYKKRLAFL